MQVDVAQLERLTPLVESKPIAAALALFILTTISLLGLLVRSYQKRVTQADEHKDEIKALLNAERERQVKQETVNSGLLKFFDLGAITVRAGKPKRVRLHTGRVVVGWFIDEPVDPLAPEAPTVNTLKPGGENAP